MVRSVSSAAAISRAPQQRAGCLRSPSIFSALFAIHEFVDLKFPVAIPVHLFPAVLAIEGVGWVVVREALQGQRVVVREERSLTVLQEPRAKATSVVALVDHHQIDHWAFADR